MPPSATPSFKGSTRDLFSPAEVRALMRAEFERSRRYAYPIVLLLISVDRLAQLQDLYGYELKEQVFQSLSGLLRTATRASDSYAALVDDRVVVLVPHTPPEGSAALARRVLEGMRAIRFECDGRTTRVTISIGGAHNQKPGELSFETMLEVAEGGLAVASAAGGDRYVHSDLYEFFEKKREREARESKGARAAASAPAAIAAPAPQALTGELLGEKIRELFGIAPGDTLTLGRIEQEVILSALRELRGELAESLTTTQEEHRRQVDMLERRIAKLTAALGTTEAELQRVLARGTIDAGVASIYRSVQGLSSDAAQAELKKELMKKLFEANVELRKQFSAGAS
jgi:diguanylate cyclase (GGDEF)-like protein